MDRGRAPGAVGLWRRLATAALLIGQPFERGRQRRALQLLDQRLLRDVGLTRADVEIECAKPIWR